MIKSAAGAACYLVDQANRRTDLTAWYDGIIDGTGLGKGDPAAAVPAGDVQHARRQAGQPMRRRDTREHVTLYLKAFNAWRTGEPLPQLASPPAKTCPASPPSAERVSLNHRQPAGQDGTNASAFAAALIATAQTRLRAGDGDRQPDTARALKGPGITGLPAVSRLRRRGPHGFDLAAEILPGVVTIV